MCAHAHPWLFHPLLPVPLPLFHFPTPHFCRSTVLVVGCLSPSLPCARIQCTLPEFLFSRSRRLYPPFSRSLCRLLLLRDPLFLTLAARPSPACPALCLPAAPATRAPRHPLVPRTPTPSPSAHGCHLLPWPSFSLHPACCGRFTSRYPPPPSPCALLSTEGPSSACRPRPSACLLLRDSSPQERGAPPVGHFPPFSGAQHAYALRGRRNGTNPPHAL